MLQDILAELISRMSQLLDECGWRQTLNRRTSHPSLRVVCQRQPGRQYRIGPSAPRRTRSSSVRRRRRSRPRCDHHRRLRLAKPRASNTKSLWRSHPRRPRPASRRSLNPRRCLEPTNQIKHRRRIPIDRHHRRRELPPRFPPSRLFGRLPPCTPSRLGLAGIRKPLTKPAVHRMSGTDEDPAGSGRSLKVYGASRSKLSCSALLTV